MPFREPVGPYPRIDSDPHVSRVIRYMRPSDYGVWAAGTAAFPLGYWWVETRQPVGNLGTALKFCTALGFFGGFMIAHQRSSYRFWGWTENAREIAKDQAEYKAAREQGLQSHLPQSTMEPYLQAVAARHSRLIALSFSWVPWFNFVDHNLGVNKDLYKEEQ
ncbi:hypothetical protein RI367_001249 [Sorochytrium milnesiophthora]